MKKLMLGLIFFVIGGGLAFGANPETFNVNMILRQVITITNTAPLNFGTLELIAGGYTVNAGAGPHAAGAGAAAAAFTVQGETGATADVSFVTNPVVITDGTTNVNVTLSLASATHIFTGGAETLYVGGAVTLAGTETTGTYTGTAQLQMVYQ